MTDKTLLLFDVDGTLTMPRQGMEPNMRQALIEARKKVKLAVVGGSDLVKIVEQLGTSLDDVLSRFDYVFSENGLVGFKEHEPYPIKTIQDHIGEKKLQQLINFCLGYMSKIELPVKRGTFVEFRKGMLNISPIGRSCSQSERLQFVEYDTEHKIREHFVEELRKNFPIDQYGLQFSIVDVPKMLQRATAGGQISVDVFPVGWDKTFCLENLSEFDTIHFFGDKTMPGGNDYEIYEHPRTIGHFVNGPDDTIAQIQKLLL